MAYVWIVSTTTAEGTHTTIVGTRQKLQEAVVKAAKSAAAGDFSYEMVAMSDEEAQDLSEALRVSRLLWAGKKGAK